MESSIEQYLEHLDKLVGKEGQPFEITEQDQRPAIWVYNYIGVPETGNITAFTYGLSSVEYPEWIRGRPELLINVASNNIDWALAAGFLVKKYRGRCPFSYGNIIRFGERITKESEMTAFFVFAPSLFDQEETYVKLPDRTINLVQIYPIYEEEIELITSVGVQNFFQNEEIDFCDVHRQNMG